MCYLWFLRSEVPSRTHWCLSGIRSWCVVSCWHCTIETRTCRFPSLGECVALTLLVLQLLGIPCRSVFSSCRQYSESSPAFCLSKFWGAYVLDQNDFGQDLCLKFLLLQLLWEIFLVVMKFILAREKFFWYGLHKVSEVIYLKTIIS